MMDAPIPCGARICGRCGKGKSIWAFRNPDTGNTEYFHADCKKKEDKDRGEKDNGSNGVAGVRSK